jgi:hypothetical protein
MALGAATWMLIGMPDGDTHLIIEGYSDPDDPYVASIRRLPRRKRRSLHAPPHIRNAVEITPLYEPVDGDGADPWPDEPAAVGDQEWSTQPNGRIVVDAGNHRGKPLTELVYAFWRLQAQKFTTTQRPRHVQPGARFDRSIRHDTRIVLLRRQSVPHDHDADAAAGRYSVRFVVRGHWRRLVDKHGNSNPVWVQSHVKGPEDAPLLGGTIVKVLGR